MIWQKQSWYLQEIKKKETHRYQKMAKKSEEGLTASRMKVAFLGYRRKKLTAEPPKAAIFVLACLSHLPSKSA
jgi:hypothetical protein